MLWSLIKILLFVAIVAGLTIGALYLMDLEGGVQVTAGGTELTLGAFESVLAAVAIFVVVWIVLKLISLLYALFKFLNGDETALSRWFDRGRERRGYQALNDALIALAAGDGKQAIARANRAERYLHKPELTNLIKAQAAELIGDTATAAATYKKMIADDATRFVGIRGILTQKLADGDTETALKLAEKAHALRPKHEEVQDILLRLQAQNEDWPGSRNTWNPNQKYGALPPDRYTPCDAALAFRHPPTALAS